ncbi:MAG: DUF664 domain-containing protein [Phycisphaera sp. RhM]|nr:DUF664 domain-containing protein [Phycisphaera sp. RhM]
MTAYELIDDLFAYNRWANAKIATLCQGLRDAQLDAKRELGFGTLRGTLFHLLTAERVWMERWTGAPWRPFPTDPDGMSLDEFSAGLAEVAAQRRSLIEIHRATRWREPITYLDSKKTEFTHSLFDLLLHVANHGVHHRAQALYFLKQYDRTAPAGLDYIFYRLAATTVEQSPESVQQLQTFGLDVATIQTPDPRYDAALIERLFQYQDWANNEILSFCDTVEVAALDRDFQMGCGSIRKSLLHLMNADRWWVENWNGRQRPFPQSAPDTPLVAIRKAWAKVAKQRNEFLAGVDSTAAMEVVTIEPDGPPTAFRVGESALHLALHGTHHRAQVINMLRRSGGRIRNLDMLYWPALSSR